jgi:hypothetical protein
MKKVQRIVLVLGLLFLWMTLLNNSAKASPASAPTPKSFMVPFYSTPKQADLCGEPVPLHHLDVWERFDKEFTIVVYSHAQVYLWLKRMERYFPWLEEQLRRQGLPEDLKYVAVAESDLLFHARSPKGATGPWQFIQSTGRRYGLTKTKFIDERRDFEMATMSAFRYLRDLYGMFRNWTLAIAAYNCGEGRIKTGLRKQAVGSYYFLALPLETERYIFRILAIKEILSHPKRYGYHLPKGAGYPNIPMDRVSIRVSHSLSIQTAAEAAGITYREFKILNPAFISDTIPSGSYVLKVPKGRGGTFRNGMKTVVRDQPKPKKSAIVHHKVKKGESLGSIANRYQVSVRDLRKWNGLRSDTIHKNQRLKIYKD